MRLFVIENVFTVVITAITVLGLYAMSHSWHSLWPMLFLLNLNYPAAGREVKP